MSYVPRSVIERALSEAGGGALDALPSQQSLVLVRFASRITTWARETANDPPIPPRLSVFLPPDSEVTP